MLNNDLFIIERSLNGKDFYQIGKVLGQGNSSSLKQYSFIDDSYLDGARYYRLKQVDFNGQHKYSSVVHFKNDNVSVFYNQNKMNFYFGNQLDKIFEVNIYDLNGKLIFKSYLKSNEFLEWSKKGFYLVAVPEINFRQRVVCY